MNAPTISLIIMYAMAAIIMAICILKDMHRSVLRGCVSLGLAVLSIPLTIVLTHNTLDRVTTNLLRVVDLSSIAPLTEAIPSLEESAVALVHMVIATEICRLVFFVLLALLTLIGHFVCVAIEKKKPALAKKSKPIGAAIGVAFGLVMIVAVLAPTAGYAAEAPEVIHILGEVEQVTHEGEEAMSDEAVTMQQAAQKVSDTALLKMVRALGGKAIFRATTSVEIGGLKTDLYSEFHALDAVAGKLTVLTSVPIAEYGDPQYDAIKALADDIEASVLLRTLSAEGLSSLSNAWLSGESFMGIDKPSDGGAVDVAVNVLLKRFKDTTKDTVAEDIRKLSPAVASAIKAFNVYSSMQTSKPTPGTSDASGTPDAPTEQPTIADTLKGVMDTLGEAMEDEATKELVVEIGAGIIIQELEKFIVPSAPTEETPSEGENKDEQGSSSVSGGVNVPFIDLGVSLGSLVPWLNTDVLPAEEETVITQDELNDLVTGVTDMVVSGVLEKPAEEVVSDLKDLRDQVGVDISDELCEALVNGFLNSEYANMFGGSTGGASGNVPEDIPEDILDNLPDEIPEDIPEDILDDLPDEIPEDILDNLPDEIPEDILDNLPEDIPEDILDNLPDEIPEGVLDNLPEGIPEGLLGGLTGDQ